MSLRLFQFLLIVKNLDWLNLYYFYLIIKHTKGTLSSQDFSLFLFFVMYFSQYKKSFQLQESHKFINNSLQSSYLTLHTFLVFSFNKYTKTVLPLQDITSLSCSSLRLSCTRLSQIQHNFKYVFEANPSAHVLHLIVAGFFQHFSQVIFVISI